MNTKIYAEVLEEGVLEQFNAAMALPYNVQGALMPDAHLGYTLPIGAVIKSKGQIFPSFVGYDIGCGVAAVEFNLHKKYVGLEALKEYILDNVPIGSDRRKEGLNPEDMPSFEGTSDTLKKIYSQKGANQLGTLGSGNHFIEVGYMESNDNIAVVIHSGSRGLGHGVASHYMRKAANKYATEGWPKQEEIHIADFTARNEIFRQCSEGNFIKARDRFVEKQKLIYMKKHDVEGLFSFDVESDMGAQYIRDMNFCLDYALLNRTVMARAVQKGISKQLPTTTMVPPLQFINRNHNHAEVQTVKHTNENGTSTNIQYIIHRKGATHADKDMMGVIPGNMKDGSFIIKGKGNPDSLNSSSHGAGRVLSRRQAKKTLSIDEFNKIMEGVVTNHTDATLDESPKAYKNIFEVMRLQGDLVEVIDRVIPTLNIKG